MESLTETNTPDSEPIEPCHDNPQQKPHTAVSQNQMRPATPKPTSSHKLHTRVDGLLCG